MEREHRFLEELSNIKAGTKWLEEKLPELAAIEDNVLSYNPVPSTEEIEKRILFNNMIIKIAESYRKVHEEFSEYPFDIIPFGNYLSWNFGFDVTGNSVYFELVLADNTGVRDDLYDYILGSYSKVGEWAQKVILPLIAVLFDEVVDLHNFNICSLSRISSFFKYCGKRPYGPDNTYILITAGHKDKYDEDVTYANRIFDCICQLAKNKELMDDFDRILETYFKTIFKYTDAAYKYEDYTEEEN